MANPALSPVLLFKGGPDREHDVSLKSGTAVAAALREAGHGVTEITLSSESEAEAEQQVLNHLDLFCMAQPDGVVFPVLHGRWGEGGGIQQILEAHHVKFVGATSQAAALCMHKAQTKDVLREAELPTPQSETIQTDNEEPMAATHPTLAAPVVIKAVDEGSSLGLEICGDAEAIEVAFEKLRPIYPNVLVEQFIDGPEFTVSVIQDADGQLTALPIIQIVPQADFYDYAAKYDRDDTEYRFDLEVNEAEQQQMSDQAIAAFRALGCRHLTRIDFMMDRSSGALTILEANTMPGFTDHSLLPKAAAQAGWTFPQLVSHLVQCAADDVSDPQAEQAEEVLV